MHIEYTDEQAMLRDSAVKYLRDSYTFEKRQAVIKAGEGFSREQWQAFAEMGWLAMTFPEECGGFDAGALETMLLFEAFGQYLVTEPYLETVVLAGGFIQQGGSEALRDKYLEGIATGEVQGAFAHTERQRQARLDSVATTAKPCAGGYEISGEKAVVFNGPAADVIIVTARTSGERDSRDGISLFALDAGSEGLSRRDYPTYDGRHASELTLDKVVVPETALVGELDNAMPLVDKVVDRALLAVSAEAVGAMESLNNATIEYTKQRKQFGQPIAKFQVLRHRMADMYIEYELTRSLLLAAASKLDEEAEDASRVVAALKARVGKTGKYVGQNAIQLHGGIGMTDELSVGHYFKRLTMIENLFGGRDQHLARYKDLQGTKEG